MKNPKVKQEVINLKHARAKRRKMKEVLFGEWGDVKKTDNSWKTHRKTKWRKIVTH